MSSNYSDTQLRKQAVERADATSAPGLRLAEVMRNMSKELGGGSPSVYKLHMNDEMRNTKGTITRRSLGTPKRVGLGETEKVFMVVGATGAGKTTLINGMVNYILGVQWKDDFRFKSITEETEAAQAFSQTQDITAYTFYPMQDPAVEYTFTVIDTPGYGATEGVKRDKKITKQIKEFFSRRPPHGIDHLDGVGFVVQASQGRLTPTQVYIFDSILAIFGNDVSKNIFMMITFADNQRPPVLDSIKELLKVPSHGENVFKFNSSALFAENDAEGFNELFWKMCFRSFSKFFEAFRKTESVSLTLTQEVLEEREVLHVVTEGLHDQTTLALNKLEEMRQEEIVMQQREKEIATNKDFTYTVDMTKQVYINLEGTGRHTTTCVTCNATCHKNCKVVDDALKYGCWAMNKRGNCRICPRKCHWSEHRNVPYLIEYETITETRTAEDLKKKYHKAVQEKATSKQMMKEIEESLQGVHMEVLTMIKRAQQSLSRLDEIALKPNSLTNVEYLELLIESEKMEAKPGWKKRIQYLEEAKRHAEILSKVNDEETLERLSLGGDNWYSRFKFW